MNYKNIITFCVTTIFLSPLLAQETKPEDKAPEKPKLSLAKIVEIGNDRYNKDLYSDALEQYETAKPVEKIPLPAEILFNRANCKYKLEDYNQAIELYRDAAMRSEDQKLTARSKFNLGNTHYRKGEKVRQQKPEEALQEMKKSAGYYRQALDLDPTDPAAARNIALTRQVIKELKKIIEQNKQQKKQEQENNQDEQQQQDNNQNQDDQQDDPGDDNQQQGPQEEPQDQQDQQETEGEEDDGNEIEQVEPPNETAQHIIDNEKERRKIKLKLLRQKPVKKDW